MDQFTFPYHRIQKSALPAGTQALIEAAEAAAEGAYAPYSHFQVGAAVRMEGGRIVTGSNHENASFPAGICAERAALATIDMRAQKEKVTELAITYKGGSGQTQPLSPCGICRQTILEVQHWQRRPIKLYMCSPDGHVIVVEDAAFLLPFSFSSDYLEPTS